MESDVIVCLRRWRDFEECVEEFYAVSSAVAGDVQRCIDGHHLGDARAILAQRGRRLSPSLTVEINEF